MCKPKRERRVSRKGFRNDSLQEPSVFYTGGFTAPVERIGVHR